MKFQVCLKDPDALGEQVIEAVAKSLADLGLEADELEPLIEKRAEKIHDKLARWVEYGEYYRIEFDTDAMTATVIEVKR